MARPSSASKARAPRWQRLDADERRTQILDCARRAFTQRAFAAVSMAEIASCAGVQRGLLHHYFGSKHDLYVAVVRDLLARFGGIVDPDAHGTVPTASASDPGVPLDRLVATYVDRWLELVEQQAESWFTLIDAEFGTRDPEVVALVERARRAMVDGMVTALDLGELTPELRVVLRSYSGLAELATREWLTRGNLDRRQVQALLATALVGMVRDVAPAVEAAGQPTRRSVPAQ
jgi:AcrR family transcriptional regulator